MIKFNKLILAFYILTSLAYAGGEYTIPKDVDIENGKKIYIEKGCIGCHGPKGMAEQDSTAPALNGQFAAYQVIQLEAFVDKRHKFKRDSGNSSQMVPFAQMLTKKEMWDVSTYLNKIPDRRTFPKEWYEEHKEDINWVRTKRKAACISCHGRNYTGVFTSAPKLAGLQSKYLRDQMLYYRSGERRGGLSHHMKLLADFWSTKDTKRLSYNIEASEGKKNAK